MYNESYEEARKEGYDIMDDGTKKTLGCQLFKQFIFLQKDSVEQYFRGGAKQFGLRVGEFNTLIQIWMAETENNPATVSMLSEFNHCTKSNISQITKILEKKDYIKREPSETDHRTMFLRTTDNARNSIEKSEMFGKDRLFEAIDCFGKTKSEQLINLLTEFQKIYQQITESPAK